MFEKFTEKAKRVLFFARYEASQYGSPAVEAEHLLLGLLREDKYLPHRFLPRSTLSLDSVHKEVERRTPSREKFATSIDLPFSHEAIRVLNYSAAEAAQLSHGHIGTEHLLLGLLREEHGLAGEILRSKGLNLSAVRQGLAVPILQERVSTLVDIPFGAESLRVLDFAKEEAVRLAQPQVGPEHILLGLLREEHSPVAEMLRQKGLELSTVRQGLTEPLGMPKGSADAESSETSKSPAASPPDVESWDVGQISVLALTEDDQKFLRQLKIRPVAP